MRVEFTFLPHSEGVVFPINYNYFLTGLIYRIISNSSGEYAAFLHDRGYRHEESKNGFKLFTYSMLMGKCRVMGDRISYTGSRIQWQISSPLEEFLQHLITGVFSEGREIKIVPGISAGIATRAAGTVIISGPGKRVFQRR